MKSIITVLTILTLSLSAYAETVSSEPSPSSDETPNTDAIDQTRLSTGAHKDIVIYTPGGRLEINKNDTCNQCTVPKSSPEPDTTGH